MGKFVRKKATADSEQLLTPRKNGFFGKRNNGVRSEDPEKPKPISALRLVSSVFGGHKHKDTSKELSPLDGTPDIRMFGDKEPYLASMNGTPKTAPPSPDLVVTSNLRRDSPTQNDTPTGARAPSPNDNGNTQHTHKQNGTGAEIDGDETVMSDLTGTVSPTPHNLPLNGTPNHPTSSNSVATPHHATRPHQTAHGVTFASTPRRQDDSFYSGYSPSLSGFDGTPKDDGHMNGGGLNAADAGVGANAAGDIHCKSSVLDQMLGVVDSACHRTMDLTLGNAFSGNARGADRALSPQWGMAPSRDDDESTCFDTMGGTLTATLYTRDTGTATYTRDTATATATLPTHDTGSQHKNQDSDDKSNRSGNVRALGSSAAANQAIGGGSDSMKKLASLSSRWTDPEEQLHENFELVLGKNALTGNYGEEGSWRAPEDEAAATLTSKKRGWGSRILNNGGDNYPGHKKTLSASKLAAAGPEEEKKDDTGSFMYDQRPAQTKVEVGNMQGKPPLSPSQPVAYASFSPSAAAAVAVADNKNIGGVDRSASPSHDVGVEIQSRRVIEQQEREKKQQATNLFTASFASKNLPPPSPKKKLSSLVKKLRFGGKGVRRAKSTSQLPPRKPASPMKRAFQRPSSPVTKAQKKDTAGTSGKGTSATHPSVSKATKNVEEEKTEIEPPLDANLPTTPPAAASNVSKMEGQIGDDDAIESKPSSYHPEIAKLPPKPFLLPGRSNSFRLSNDAAYDMDKASADAQAADLTQPVTLNRLRSAPHKLASSEALEEEKKEKEEEAKPAEHEGEVKSDEAQPQGNVTKDPAKVESPNEEQDMPPLADTAKTTATAATAAATAASTTKDGPSSRAPKLTWKAAVDDQGRTYYYHRATRNTTWSKPPEFDAEMAAVQKYKEELEAARKEASETQQVVEGCESVAAIQANLRKTTQRDFDPQVWQTKQEILGIVRTMPLPKGTNIEKLLVQYDGREEQLLANLRDLVESKPFDEPFQVPKKDPPANVSREHDETPYDAESPMNTSHSSVSSANLQTVEVQSRVRTAVSASTRISEKTNITEKTEKIRNTSKGVGKGGIGTIRESASCAMSTGSISSATRGSMPPRHEAVPFDANPRVPSKIPVVPRSRDLKVEEFTSDRIAKETFNGENTFVEENTFHGENALPEEKIFHEAKLVKNASKSSIDSRRSSPSSFDAGHSSAKAVAEKIVALSALDDDDSYNGDYDDDDRGTDTASEKNADSISALSEHDADYLAQKENFERARRRALDVALEREDWDLAAALSEGMKQVKESLYGTKGPQREWTQTELDRFISENDWDAVSKYIAHMRNNPSPAPSAANKIPNLSAPRGIEPGTGRERDPDGFVSPKRNSSAAGHGTPPYVSEATKRASAHTINGRRQQRITTESSVSSSQGSNQRAQTRFGARSQLQHSDLDSIQSWDSSSSYDSEYTDNSYESEEEQGYISLRRRRPEFEC